MQTAMIKDLPRHTFFKRKPDAKRVYIRQEYYQDTKRYQCDDCDDVWGNGIQLKGTTLVYVDFEY